MRTSHSYRLLRGVLATLMLLLGGCAAMRPAQFANATPQFDPIAFLTGPTRSWGVMENRDGEPLSRFRTAMMGRMDGDTLVITQDFTFEDGRTQQRIWRLRRVDAHRSDATAGDVIGIATGYAYGNAFRWEYTLQLKPGNPLSRVHMKHWMYLVDGGDMLINRVVISKLGITVRETTEYFRRGAGVVPTVGAPR